MCREESDRAQVLIRYWHSCPPEMHQFSLSTGRLIIGLQLHDIFDQGALLCLFVYPSFSCCMTNPLSQHIFCIALLFRNVQIKCLDTFFSVASLHYLLKSIVAGAGAKKLAPRHLPEMAGFKTRNIKLQGLILTDTCGNVC